MDLASLIWSLFLDTSASWLRMFAALGFSIVLGLAFGILSARNELAERIIIPIVDILQTLPILAFFPFAIYVVVTYLPPYMGINAAVVFLIITSMLWNIIFGAYEAIKTLPNELVDVARLYKMGFLERLRRVYIPAAMPRVAEQSTLSWAIGLFYLVTSEIFSTGNANYSVSHGIGVALTQLAASGNFTDYAIGLGMFVVFVVATVYLFLNPFVKRFSNEERMVQRPVKHRLYGGVMHRFRLSGYVENIYRNLPHRRAARAKRLTREQPGAVLTTRGGKHSEAIELSVLALIILLIVLYITNSLNASIVYYEETALVALAFSFARVWLTFLVILAVAIPLCVWLVFLSKKGQKVTPLFYILASIPATIILPVIAIGVSGLPDSSELTAFIVFFLSGIWYVIFGVLASTRTLDPEIFEMKRIFNVKGWQAWKQIYIKAIIPGLITGAVTGIAAEWNASIVAEYFTNTGVSGTSVISSVGTGIGKLLDLSLSANNLALMAVALINLTLMIIIINTFLWKRLYKRVADVYK